MRRLQYRFLTLPRPQKSQKQPQKALNDFVLVNIEYTRNFGLLRKQKLIVYMSRPQNSFLIQPQLQDSLAQPQKGQNDPQIGQN